MVPGALDELVRLHVGQLIGGSSPDTQDGVTVMQDAGCWRVGVNLKDGT